MGLMKLKPSNKLNEWAKKEAQRVANVLYSETEVQVIYLFGSSVNGSFTKESDLDMLLVFSDQVALQAAKKVVYNKPISKTAVDYILKTESDFDNRKQIGGVCFHAFRDGVILSDQGK